MGADSFTPGANFYAQWSERQVFVCGGFLGFWPNPLTGGHMRGGGVTAILLPTVFFCISRSSGYFWKLSFVSNFQKNSKRFFCGVQNCQDMGAKTPGLTVWFCFGTQDKRPSPSSGLCCPCFRFISLSLSPLLSDFIIVTHQWYGRVACVDCQICCVPGIRGWLEGNLVPVWWQENRQGSQNRLRPHHSVCHTLAPLAMCVVSNQISGPEAHRGRNRRHHEEHGRPSARGPFFFSLQSIFTSFLHLLLIIVVHRPQNKSFSSSFSLLN